VTDVEFWPTRDRELASSPDALDRLCGILKDCRPELIYAPSPYEFHPDHRAAAELIWRAVNQTGIEADVAFYESNRPIPINKLVDIGAVNDRKLQACNAYQSQLRNYPYAEMALSLSRYRTLTVSPKVTHAEGFFVLSSAEMRGRPPGWFTVRQHLPMAAPGDGDRPLVSVIIRTKNRRLVLRQALSSVLSQTYPNIEVVIVNAGRK
jgi:hypothetical protein